MTTVTLGRANRVHRTAQPSLGGMVCRQPEATVHFQVARHSPAIGEQVPIGFHEEAVQLPRNFAYSAVASLEMGMSE